MLYQTEDGQTRIQTRDVSHEIEHYDLSAILAVGQAKDYAKKLATRWAYSINGQGIYQVDTGRDAVANGRNVIDGNHGTAKSHDSDASHKSQPLETEITNLWRCG